jgi:hypothetical protein
MAVEEALTDTRAGLTEYEPTHKLEARQYSNAECGSDFTTLNGLNVTTYCDQSIEKNSEQHTTPLPTKATKTNKQQMHSATPSR